MLDFVTRFLVVSAAAVVAAVPSVHADFQAHSAYYDVRINVLKGAMTTELRKDEAGYRGTSRIKPRGLARFATRGEIVNQSIFQLSDQGVQPLAFTGSDMISKRKKQASLNFDWDALRVTGQAAQKKSGKRIETVIDTEAETDMHDAISLQYALMHDLHNDALKAHYTLLDGSDIKRINITRLEPAALRVPYGEFDVVPVQHQVEGSSRITTFWLAEELGYLPIKIEQTRKGKRLMRAELGNYELINTDK
ncbi:MAG: DUF3108 domain-containing protein [Pseudomonadota bacterium]